MPKTNMTIAARRFFSPGLRQSVGLLRQSARMRMRGYDFHRKTLASDLLRQDIQGEQKPPV
jgi:hypothetical protein